VKKYRTPDKKTSPGRRMCVPRIDRGSVRLIYNPGFPIVERRNWNSD
jgi:hypothetical protein